MNINRGLVFWGVALITAGAVALAIQSGIIAGDSAGSVWRLWPVVLIIVGLAVISARTPFALVGTLLAGLVVGALAGTLVGGFPKGVGIGCGGDADRSVSDEGSFGGRASVELDFTCGALRVATASGTTWRVDALYGGDGEPNINASESSLRVAAEGDNVFGFDDHRQEWDVTLPTEADLDLAVNANAAESVLDLEGATLTSLEVDANAGDFAMRLPSASVANLSIDANAGAFAIDADEATVLDGSVSMNAGSLKLCAPDTAGIEITIEDENVTFSHNLDDRGLSQRGDTWSTAGDAAITLEVSGNAASLELNPEGGCR